MRDRLPHRDGHICGLEHRKVVFRIAERIRPHPSKTVRQIPPDPLCQKAQARALVDARHHQLVTSAAHVVVAELTLKIRTVPIRRRRGIDKVDLAKTQRRISAGHAFQITGNLAPVIQAFPRGRKLDTPVRSLEKSRHPAPEHLGDHLFQHDAFEVSVGNDLAVELNVGTAQNDTTSQHTPEGSVLLTPEQIQQALDSGALEDAEAQCIDLTDENGFFRWLFNWLFGSKDKEEEPAPAYSGWRTENGKTYYYAQNTNKKVTGLRSIDGKLYYFDANGVKQDNVTFGIDVSKYQSGLDWNKIKKSGVSFVIIRIGYRGYGAAGNLVKDPMFEEHFTNARNAGLKVGVYFFTQAVNEAEAQEEADGCNWALNGRMLDYPIFYDTEASTAPGGTGRADGLGAEDRTKCAIAFCERVKALGYKPGVYASTTWYRKRVNYNTLRSRYTIWNAHYGVSSSPIGCDMWQGTRTAHINGYSGELDANISYIG